MKLKRQIKRQNVRSGYKTCKHSRFALSNGINAKGVRSVMYTEYAYIKLRYLR